MNNIKWIERNTTEEGNTFADGNMGLFDGFGYLARETIQNSLDAYDNDSKQTLKITFSVDDIPTSKFLCNETLIKHLQGTIDISGQERCDSFCKNAIEILKSDNIRILKISDFNTTGVLGSNNLLSKDSKWKALIYDEGSSPHTDDTSAGSYGLGKNAAFAFSAINTVYYVTKAKDNNYAMEGVAKLYSSKVDGERKARKLYFGQDLGDKSAPITDFDSSNLPSIFARNEYGTDVIIMGIMSDAEQIKRKIIRAVIENFFVRIIDNNLIVNVLGEEINPNNIFQVTDKYYGLKDDYEADKTKSDNLKNYLYTYTKKYETDEFVDEVAGFGKVKLIISKDPAIGNAKVVAMFRKHGMKIFEYSIKSADQPFCAIFKPNDDEGEKFLRKIETPTHDKFVPGDEKSIESMTYKRLMAWIKDTVQKYTEIDYNDQDFLEGIEDYIQLEDNDNTMKKKINSPTIDVVNFIPEKHISNMYEEGTVQYTDPEELLRRKKTKEKGKIKIPSTTTGEDAIGIKKDYCENFKLFPKLLSHSNETTVCFSIDDQSNRKINLELYTVGEDDSVSDYLPKIIKAVDLNNNNDLEIKDNSIKNINKNEINSIKIIFDRPFNAKYKVLVYMEENNENKSK